MRPFELLALGTSPLDWFEAKISVILNLAVFIKVGLFIKIPLIGKIEVVLYKKKWEYKQNLLGPITLQPKMFSKVAEVSSSGQLLLQEPGLMCESKGGSVGEEGKWHAVRVSGILHLKVT